ncbi:Uncharacterised protein [Mycobacteroides abscessus subsp. massiliense]|uniref:hypothetical protein n=1 Tax=Mycobacteroides abscessus TaxID=36809 RepID=UPI0009A697EA|nr:hypothetical protein [Mycobacteroides abscessus]MDO3055630.1 hypothetical protein [Mycobacteroides abscessus subsp. massiliense]SLC38106.1 Uncharacterised protein [Mycobacteroides abscessus subsp. massiliense]SLH30428.1 Uncharacterised protein [Mycobacteroides abscessus subsp. massiliense]SLI03516.1 Uncharacterised protein [Mycobacteroides abscessus subsp. massiliense]
MNSVAPAAQSKVDKFAPDPTNPFGVAPLGIEIDAIERECAFWTSSMELSYICAIAHKRGVGRWALLGAVLANLLSWLPPYVVMCDLDGSTNSVKSAGSLNFFLHLVEESGQGKTRLMGVADEVVPPNTQRYGSPKAALLGDPDALTSGTGEGLCKHFVGVGKDPKAEDPKSAVTAMLQKTDVAFTVVDEVSTYISELARPTSKSAGILTSLWSGQSAGTNTSSADNRLKVPAHAARVINIMLAQPELCGELFTEKLVAGGTPQRPVWLPGADWTPCPVTSVPTDPSFRRPSPPKNVHNILYARHGLNQKINAPDPQLDFPRIATSPDKLLWIHHSPQMAADLAAEKLERESTKLSPAQKVALTAEEREARKGQRILQHMTFTRIKVAVALALLHGRTDFQPNDLDWMLAGVVMRVNRGMLAYLWLEGKAYRDSVAKQAGEDRAAEKGYTDDALAAAKEKKIDALVLTLREILATKRPMTNTELRRKLSPERQKLLPEALNREGAFFQEDGTGLWFPWIEGSIWDNRYEDKMYRRPTTPLTVVKNQ